MTHSLALVLVGLRIGRWILPWVAVVFVSATLAYAINGAIAGGSSARDQRGDVQVAVSTGAAAAPAVVEQSTTSPLAESADLGPFATPERCAPIGGSGYGSYVDSSIVAESRRINCGHGEP
jgi:hypothetical protein